jgi:hypothetical protein
MNKKKKKTIYLFIYLFEFLRVGVLNLLFHYLGNTKIVIYSQNKKKKFENNI